MMKKYVSASRLLFVAGFALAAVLFHIGQNKTNPLNAPPAQPPFTDFRYEKPGTLRKITVKDLPPPHATKSATNGPSVIDRPANATPVAPAGFKVELFATGFKEPRKIITAPNGDIFLVEQRWRRKGVSWYDSRRQADPGAQCIAADDVL